MGSISQINRSAVSIPSNIAEGNSRDSQKDFRHFLRIALGPCFELETQILIVEKLSMISDKILLEALKPLVDEEQKMIMSLMKSLK